VDETFEQRMPHSATVKGAGLKQGRPWLVSQVMYTNLLRHIDAGGTAFGELQAHCATSQAACKSQLNHLGWWGYVTGAKPAGVARPKPSDHIISFSPGGQQACEMFEPIPCEVEQRWSARFGKSTITELRRALEPFAGAAPSGLPHHLPVVQYGEGMRTQVEFPAPARAEEGPAEELDLSALMAQTLLLLTLDFEAESEVSLPHLANILRVLEVDLLPSKEIHQRAGVSKESVSASLTYLTKQGLLASEGKGASALVCLTPEGKKARSAANRRMAAMEKSSQVRHGKGTVDRLRTALDSLLSQGEGPGSKMAEGLASHEGGWRTHKNYAARTEAVLADPRGALPHHPMVTHRGGFPDGS
jgi:predicted transcriptional regulator